MSTSELKNALSQSLVNLLLRYSHEDFYNSLIEDTDAETSELGKEQNFRALVKHGADVNFKNGLPIKICLQKMNADALELLLAFGADPNIDNGYAVKYCCENGLRKSLDILFKYDVDPNLPVIDFSKAFETFEKSNQIFGDSFDCNWKFSCMKMLLENDKYNLSNQDFALLKEASLQDSIILDDVLRYIKVYEDRIQKSKITMEHNYQAKLV